MVGELRGLKLVFFPLYSALDVTFLLRHGYQVITSEKLSYSASIQDILIAASWSTGAPKEDIDRLSHSTGRPASGILAKRCCQGLCLRQSRATVDTYSPGRQSYW